ncbi:unnamed protein product [Diamesa serratosioi]
MSPMKKIRHSTCDNNNPTTLRLKCVKPKIDTHWKNGTPLICKKITNAKSRRRTVAYLPRKSSNSEEDNEEEVFEVNNTKSNFVTPKVLKNLNNLSENFSRFFSLMETSYKNTKNDEKDIADVQQKVREISDDIQKMNDLVDDLCKKTANVTEFLLGKNIKSKQLASV